LTHWFAGTRGLNLLWIRPVEIEQELPLEERRIRDFVDSPSGVSESVESLSDKLGISRRRCRRILEQLVEQGVVQRREFTDIQPLYVRFPTL
jgi:ribosomal protein S25